MPIPEQAPVASTSKPRRKWLRKAGLMLFFLLSCGGWLIGTESGLQALVRMVSWASGGRVVVDAPTGRLIGPLHIGGLQVSTNEAVVRLDDMGFDWQPSALLRGQMAVDYLTLGSVRVNSLPVPPDDTPVQMPADLRLPLGLQVDRLEVGEFILLDQQKAELPADVVFTFSGLQAGLQSDGVQHRIDRLTAETEWGQMTASGVLSGDAPFELSVQAALEGIQHGHAYRLEAGAEGSLQATQLKIVATGAEITGQAEIEAAVFERLPVHRVHVAVANIDPSVFVPDVPQVVLQVEADLKVEGDAVENAVLSGPLRVVNLRPLTLDQNGLPFEQISAVLRWEPTETRLDKINLVVSKQGRLTGQLTLQTPQQQEAEGAGVLPRMVAALQLRDINSAEIDRRLPQQQIFGQLDATADVQHQAVKLTMSVGSARIEAQGEVHSEPTDAERTGRGYTLSARLRSVNPRTLYVGAPEGLLNLDFSGRGRLDASFQLEGDFAFKESRLRGHPLAGKGRFQIKDGILPLVDIVLDLAGNHLAVNGAWGQDKNRLNFIADAPALDVMGDGFGGRAKIEGVLEGTASAPAGKVVFFVDRLRLPGVRIAAANGQGRLDAGKEGIFQVVAGVSGVTGVAGEPGEDAAIVDALRVSIQGRRNQHQIDFFTQRQADTLDIHLDGGLLNEKGQISWRGTLARFVTEGHIPLQLSAPVALEAGSDRVALSRAEFASGAQGRVVLERTTWSPGDAAFRGHVTGVRLELLSRPNLVRGRANADPLTLGAVWDIRLGRTIEGDARIFRESGDLAIEGEIRTQLGLEQMEARLMARNSLLTLALDLRGKELGNATGTLSAQFGPTEGGGWQIVPSAPLTGSARLVMPSIAWVGRLLEEHVETIGQLNAEVTLKGTFSAPQTTGRIVGEGLQFAWVDQGLVVSGGEMLAEFDRDRLRLSRLQFSAQNRIRPRDNRIPFAALTASPGALRASGEIALVSGEGRFDFSADRFPLFQQPERWLLVSGRGTIRSSWSAIHLDADIRADAGYIELADSAPPSLSDDVVVLGRAPAKESGGMALNADMRLSLGDALFLSGLGVNTRLAGQLRLRQSPDTPLIATGAIETVDGRFRGYGQNLAIVQGLITFQGALDNPGLNIIALRTGLPVEAGVSISGSASRPQMQLVSEPPVPDPEKLSWLVLGRPPAAGGGGDLAALWPAAQALLVGVGGNVAEDLSHSLGFDSFSIGQGDSGGGGVVSGSRVAGGNTGTSSDPALGGQVLALGKRLSSDLLLSFEQSLGGAETLVRLSYQLSRRVSLVARSGTDNALDIYYSFSFR